MGTRKPKIGVRDVAKAADVSVGTVSHFINGRFVSPERSERIKAAIEQLGFSSNLLARSMRTQKSSVVGLCVPHTSFSHYAAVVDEIEQRTSDAGYEVMQVLSRQDPERELQRVRRLEAFKVGGLFLVPSMRPERIMDHLAASQLPTVVVLRPISGETRFDQVAVDHKKLLGDIGREYIRRGHRSILLIVQFPKLILTRQRIEGLKAAVAESGERVSLKIIWSSEVEADFDAVFREALFADDKPTAVILSNATMATWAIRTLRRLKMAGPDTISMMTLDDPPWADLVEPGLGYVKQPSKMIAHIAWDMLATRMEDPDTPVRRVLIDSTVCWRGAR